MTNRRTRLQRELETLREGLGKLDAFAGVVRELSPTSATTAEHTPRVIDLVEVSPGVFATPLRPRPQVVVVARAKPPSLLQQMLEGLDRATELEAAARALAKEKPWKRK